MAIKLTKNEQKVQKDHLKQYQRYLPTQQLKKQQLQSVIMKTKAELEHYTLELYAARIFDNPKWVDYEAFAKHYGYQPQSYEE